MSTWRFTDDQGVERELPTNELRSALASGTLLPSTLVWREGMKEWQPAFTLPELATAAIAAARGPRSKSMPPVPPKRGPMRTLLGVEAPLANTLQSAEGSGDRAPPKPRTAAENVVGPIVVPSANPDAPTAMQTRPVGGPGVELDTIPRAPRLPRETSPTPASDPPVSTGQSSVNGGSRPRSVPPPLPGSVRQTNKVPMRLPTPAPFQSTSQRRPTLMGFPRPPAPSEEDRTVTVTKSDLIDPSRAGTANAQVNAQVTRSKPPPPPPKRSKPPEEDETIRTPPPSDVAKVRPKPPSPPKRSIPPTPEKTPDPTPAPTLVSPAASAPTLVSAATPAPTPVASTPAAPTPVATVTQPSPASAAAKASPPKRSQTLQMDAIPDRAPDKASSDKVASEKAASEKAQAQPKPRPEAPKPVDPRNVPGETTDQIARPALLGAKELLATLGDESDEESSTLVRRSAKREEPVEDSESLPSSRRAKTLEMSLADHEDAAQSEPVPKTDEPSSSPPRSATDKLPPPSRVPSTDADDSGDEPSLSRSPRSRHRGQAFQIPRRSILGASALWMIGLVSFFFVGRCSGIRRATEIEDAHAGLGKALLLRALPEVALTNASPLAEPKPCWVARQPARWAKEASKNVPFDSEATSGSMALGYAVSDKQAVGIVIDPKTGKFEEKLRKKSDTALARVSPMANADGGFYLSTKGDKDIVAVNAEKPFYLIFDKDSVGHADSPDASATEIFHLDGDGDVTAPQVLETKPAHGTASYFLAFRRGTSIYAGAFGETFAPVGTLATITGSGGKTGKPKTAFNGTEVAVVFADLPEGGKWQVRLGHSKLGAPLDATTVVDLPEGGPGGDRIAPDIVGLEDGRWILMWTEGSSGERAIRAITLSRDFQPIGDPIALSPPAGDFGQASLGVVGTYTTVVFLQRADDAFEMWGAVLQCG